MAQIIWQLYTISTVVLVLQSLYYDHLYSWWKSQKIEHSQRVCCLISSLSNVLPSFLNVNNPVKFLRLKKRKNYWCRLSKLPTQVFQYLVAPPYCSTIWNLTTRNFDLSHVFRVIWYKQFFSWLKRKRIYIIGIDFSGRQDPWLAAALHQLGPT